MVRAYRRKVYVVADVYPTGAPEAGRWGIFGSKDKREQWKKDNPKGLWERIEFEAVVR